MPLSCLQHEDHIVLGAIDAEVPTYMHTCAFMSVCMIVCMHECLYTHVYIQIYIYIYKQMNTLIILSISK